MSDFIISIDGTPAGAQLAMFLALFSAVAHALFGALQKGRYDPWLTRGAIDIFYGAAALPVALIFFPLPDRQLLLILVGVLIIHTVYKLLMAMAYSRAAYTVVYPVVRGTSPFVTVIFAYMVFGEVFEPMQWAGVALLSGAILSLALVNLAREKIGRAALKNALIIAFIGGLTTAGYTTYDAWGIRLTADPLQFLVWFFVVDGLFVFPWIALVRWRRMADRPAPGPLLRKGAFGALVAVGSFGAVMLATRLDSVGEAAVLRETSTVFAALIGWFVLKEPVGPLRAGLMALIALGAVLVEFGG
ncbi:drug/metabolite transporter (DMT)-like permease [Rubricella aquisinus]|uniref:Drug/metabolite transporter (DMT)-like permease n=1 Tax=Rubricella aquisinus TaxID=2028108 RepID=A0A840WZX7_9RHOB|nr:DMT family transporter [Rubricella aquisinus]MBB5516024.1 drug/metabolite transporter (DMT)-like permease [Rubricella aquisinus]